MADTWTDTAGILRDQIGVVVTAGPAYGAREAIGVYEGDTALIVVLTDAYEANDGTLRDSKPVFYPGTDTYEDSAGIWRDTVRFGTVVVPVAATGVLSFNGNVELNDSIQIGETDYFMVDVLVAAYDVLIGATASITINNLIAAIMNGVGEGLIYGTGTVAHPDVTAATTPGKVNVTAKVAGPDGNSIVTTANSANATWGAPTLEGGA